MLMPLDEWDRFVAPRLRNIEVRASWIKHYAKLIQDDVARITQAPSWEARAIDETKEARKDLRAALTDLDLALQKYDTKEREGE